MTRSWKQWVSDGRAAHFWPNDTRDAAYCGWSIDLPADVIAVLRSSLDLLADSTFHYPPVGPCQDCAQRMYRQEPA